MNSEKTGVECYGLTIEVLVMVFGRGSLGGNGVMRMETP